MERVHHICDAVKPVSFYEQTDYRDNWDNPSPENVAKSLRDAHAFGRLMQAANHKLVATVNELYDGKQKDARDIEELKKALEAKKTELFWEHFKNTVLSQLLTSFAVAGFIGLGWKLFGMFYRG